MGYGYPLFEWNTGIEINEIIAYDGEENIKVSEETPIQHEDNIVIIKIWAGDEANDDLDEEKLLKIMSKEWDMHT